LKEAFDEAVAAPAADVANLANGAALFLIRVLRRTRSAAPHSGKKSKKKSKKEAVSGSAAVSEAGAGALNVVFVTELYGKALADFMKKKGRARPAVFEQFCRNEPELAWGLADQFVTGIESGASFFLRCQAMAFLKELLLKKAPSPNGDEASRRNAVLLKALTAAVKLTVDTDAKAPPPLLPAGEHVGPKLKHVEQQGPKMKHVRSTLQFVFAVSKRCQSAGGAVSPSVLSGLRELQGGNLASKSAPVKNLIAQIIRTLETDGKGVGAGAGAKPKKGGKQKSAVLAAEVTTPKAPGKKMKKRKLDGATGTPAKLRKKKD
jgi:hypothetical protein